VVQAPVPSVAVADMRFWPQLGNGPLLLLLLGVGLTAGLLTLVVSAGGAQPVQPNGHARGVFRWRLRR